ncbi:MAG TPA: sugar ABC transporter permease [Clostridiaceae bacterium]|nr:sugar ABC transporter permease [Clostridiaceae bacterium]
MLAIPGAKFLGKNRSIYTNFNWKLIIPYFFVLPAILILAIFKLFPVFISLYGSLFKTGAKSVSIFVGFQNYVELFTDSIFYISLKNTVVFNLVTTPVQIFFAFLLALVFNQRLKGIKIYRSIFYMPVATSLVMATIVWSMMMNPYQGILNSFLGMFGIPNQKFLTDPKQALWCVMLIATWKGTPYWMMFLLAGLQGISDSVFEAALIDGASGLKRTVYVTIPLLKNTFGFVFISNTIANLLLFVPMYVQTKGGPMNSTNVLMYEAYKSAYNYNNMGRSYAIVGILLLLSMAFVAIQNRFFDITD